MSPKDSDVSIKGVTQIIENETKEKRSGFLSMLLGALGWSLLGNMLAGKDVVVGKQGKVALVRAGTC